jgi:hypothetical protein
VAGSSARRCRRAIELTDPLPCAQQLLGFIVETFEAVTPHTAALAVQLFAAVQHRRIVQHHVLGMAHLAARFEVFAIVERPEPVLVTSMALDHAGGGPAVATMAGRAADPFERFGRIAVGIVQPQQLDIRMAAERRIGIPFQVQIGLGQGQIRWHQGKVHADVAGLAAIHQAGTFVVDLADTNVQVVHGAEQAL